MDISWTKSVKDLEQLHSILNNLHKDLNFTLEYSGAQQSFLGVLVKNQGGKIETDIFYKETDRKKKFWKTTLFLSMISTIKK